MSFDFFDSPELLDIQRKAFYRFLNQGIPELLAKQFPIKTKSGNYSIELLLNDKNVKLITPDSNPRDCILKMKTYSCKLYAQVKIVCKKAVPLAASEMHDKNLFDTDLHSSRSALLCPWDKGQDRLGCALRAKDTSIVYQSRPEWVLLGQLPMMTKRGHFIINGSPRVIVHQVVRSPGIYFQKLVNKDDRKIARFYGDIIPLKGVWVRLQMTKKGRIEAKFKKGKKVQVEFLQKCLQVIEEKKSLSFFAYKFLRERTCNRKGAVKHVCAGVPLRGNTPITVPLRGKRGHVCDLYLPCSVGARRGTTADSKVCLAKQYPLSFAALTRLTHTLGARLRSYSYQEDAQQFGAIGVKGQHRRICVVRSYEDYSTLFNTRKSRAESKSEHEAFINTYDKLYRTTQDKELEDWQRKKSNLSFFKGLTPENAFKRKKCSENLFACFKLASRYDLGLLGREKLNDKFNVSYCTHESVLDPCVHRLRASSCPVVAPHKSSICVLPRRGTHAQQTHVPLLAVSPFAVRFACTYVQPKGHSATPCPFGTRHDKKMHGNQCQGTTQTVGEAKRNTAFNSDCITSNERKINTLQISPRLHRKRQDVCEKRVQSLAHPICVSKSCDTQLTSMDLSSASVWLYQLRKGEKNTDDIDHSQNRRVRTSGELIQTQFENGVERLKNLLSTKLQEWRGSYSRSIFPYIFKSRYKIRYSDKSLLKISRQSGFSYGKLFYAKSQRAQKSSCSFLRSSQTGSFKLLLYGAQQVVACPYGATARHARRCTAQQSQTEGLCGTRLTNRRFVSFLAPTCPTHLRCVAPHKSKICVGHGTRNDKKMHEKRSVQSNIVKRSSQGLSEKLRIYKISVKELFSTKPITGALREFFGSNPLSQYMDQTNPLAEITHKRRISSLGVGGVSRESAGMAIRGIHPTHYGRICPIETPEGKNAGLVNSLAFYTKLDINGFLKTPYYRVVGGQVQSALGFSFTSAKAESLTDLYIAPSDLQKSSNNILRSKDNLLESVPVRVTNNQLDVFKKENPAKVQLIGISPIQMISVATSLIPFLEHNDANRALMGSNMQRQAVPLMIAERPIIGTGLESIVIVESGHITESPVSGFADHITATQICIARLIFDFTKAEPYKPNSAFCAHLTFLSPEVNRGLYRASSYIKGTQGVQKALHTNPCLRARTCNIFDLHNQRGTSKLRLLRFVSKRFVLPCISKHLPGARSRASSCRAVSRAPHKSSICDCSKHRTVTSFSSTKTSVAPHKSKICVGHARQHTEGVWGTNIGQEQFSRQERATNRRFVCATSKYIPPIQSVLPWSIKHNSFLFSSKSVLTTFSRSNQNTCITEKPLIRQFDWVQKGDVLSDCSASNKGELSVGKNILVAYIPWEGYNFEDAIVISERLVREHVYTSLHIERYTFQAQNLNDGNEWFTKNLPGIEDRLVEHLEESGLPKIGSFLKEGDILVGKVRYLNKKPSSPYERLLCDILGEKNFAARNKSLYVPKGVEARVIYHKVINQFDNEPILAPNTFLKDTEPKELRNTAKTVNIFLGEKRVIQVGDKISGRHGNKGVISTILPRQDMPYLPDGTPIDLILNPLGVPSRMNVGQVLECLLGLAADYLKQNFKIAAFDEQYGVEASKSVVFLKLYQARLQSGQNWLFQVNFPGKTRLIDGRSGECFDQWITVGKAYILKLIHMVSEKIHARSTGPYALITQQPLRGRSNKGGQRLGEMEVWALEGFGAAYTLQELLTKKSDDYFGRNQIVDSILPKPPSIVDTLSPNYRVNQNRAILGHPEIFKVLLCELQALCLDLGVYVVTPESYQRSFLGIVH